MTEEGGERSSMWSDSSITSCGHLAAACMFELMSQQLSQQETQGSGQDFEHRGEDSVITQLQKEKLRYFIGTQISGATHNLLN